MNQDHTTRILDHAREYGARASRWLYELDKQKPDLRPLDHHDLLIVLHNCDRSMGWIADEVKRLEAELDAYRRAKAENDERFCIERDEARAGVERLKAEKLALIHRLEELMERWGASRNALVRSIEGHRVATRYDVERFWRESGPDASRRDTLRKCIEGLNEAISPERRGHEIP